MARQEQIQSVPTISLLDVQTVDCHPLIVSPGTNKTAVAPVFLITSCAICHVQLHCLLCTVVRTDQKLYFVSFCSLSFCLCILIVMYVTFLVISCIVLFCVLFVCKCVLYCTVLYCTVLYCTVLYCTVLYCTVLYCTVLYCTVLYCSVLYCTVLLSPQLQLTNIYHLCSCITDVTPSK